MSLSRFKILHLTNFVHLKNLDNQNYIIMLHGLLLVIYMKKSFFSFLLCLKLIAIDRLFTTWFILYNNALYINKIIFLIFFFNLFFYWCLCYNPFSSIIRAMLCLSFMLLPLLVSKISKMFKSNVIICLISGIRYLEDFFIFSWCFQ